MSGRPNRVTPDFGFYAKGLHLRPEVMSGEAKPFPSTCRWCGEDGTSQKMHELVTGAVLCPRCDFP